MYAMVLVLGLIFVFQLFGAHKTQAAIFPHIPGWVIFLWKWEMTLGATLSLFGLACPARAKGHWPDLADLLHMEGIGAFVSAFGLATYATATISLTGLHNAYPGLIIYGVLVAGHIWRGVQSLREARRLEMIVEVLSHIEEARHE